MKILTISSFLLSLMTTPTSSQVGCFNSPAGRSHAGDVFTKHIYCCFYQQKIRYLFVLKRARWKSLILDMYKLEASALNMNLCQFRYSLLSWVLQTTKAIVFLPIKACNETIPHLLLPGVGYLPGVLHPLHRTGCFPFPLHNGVTSTQASTKRQQERQRQRQRQRQ